MKKYILCFSFIILTPLSLLGQSIWTNRLFPIMASHAIRDGFGTVENFKTLEEAGFTLSIAHLSEKEEVIKHLKAASKTKVKLIVWCPEMESNIEHSVNLFSQYKSMAGYYLSDEPGCNSFSFLSDKVNRIAELDSIHIIWINLYPNYASSTQLETESYEDYIKRYIQIVNPSFVSFDNYGLKQKGLRSDFFENLEIVSRICKQNNKPFWGYVLTSQFDDYCFPTKGTLSFQAYSNLAYGAQGIEYFTYRRSQNPVLKMTMAPVDTNYSRMPIFNAVKEINSEIQFYRKYFLRNNVEDVSHFGTTIPQGSKSSTQIYGDVSLIKCDGKGFVVSFFSKRGRNYILLVNKDYERPQSITVSSKKKIKRLSYYKFERGRESGLITYNAQPGSIVLLRL